MILKLARIERNPLFLLDNERTNSKQTNDNLDSSNSHDKTSRNYNGARNPANTQLQGNWPLACIRVKQTLMAVINTPRAYFPRSPLLLQPLTSAVRGAFLGFKNPWQKFKTDQVLFLYTLLKCISYSYAGYF